MSPSSNDSDQAAQAIDQDLRRRIARGFLGNRLPGERTLAAHYGVSLRVVRKAVSGLIEAGLLRRAGQATLISHEAPRKAAGAGVVRHILMLAPQARRSEPYLHHVAYGIEQRCMARMLSFELRFTASPPPADPLDKASMGSTAWILFGMDVPDAVLRRWMTLGVVFALIDQIPRKLRVNAVAFDKEHAVLQATEHLIELGHRDIACMGAITDDTISQARQRGFRAALQRHDLPLRPDRVWSDITVDAAGRLHEDPDVGAARLLAADPLPTAVVCFNLRSAFAALAAASKRGIDVPGELSIIATGSRHTPLSADPLLARLSLIDEGQPEQLGQLAVDLLARPDPLPNPASLLLQGGLVSACSTAPPSRPPLDTRA